MKPKRFRQLMVGGQTRNYAIEPFGYIGIISIEILDVLEANIGTDNPVVRDAEHLS